MKTNLFKRIISLVLTVSMVFSLAACGQKVPATTESQSEAATENTLASEEVSSSITLVDQAGREITLEAPAETIVSCYYITTYATIALGVSDRVIGLEKKADSRPIYHMAAADLLELPNVGSMKEFNVEAAAQLNPDLVLMPMKLKDHAETLTNLGIQVMLVNPETQEAMEEMLTLIATACGVESNAQALISYYAEQLSNMADLTNNAEKPSVYMAGNSSYLQTAPNAMYQSDMITLSGGTNVASDLAGDYWTEVSYENILSMNPDIIIIPSGSDYTKEALLQDVNMADVAAVKNGAVYQMPQEIEEWDSPIPSGILGVMWLTSVLHEDAYSFDTFKEDVTNFYKTFYGFEIDTNLITK